MSFASFKKPSSTCPEFTLFSRLAILTQTKRYSKTVRMGLSHDHMGDKSPELTFWNWQCIIHQALAFWRMMMHWYRHTHIFLKAPWSLPLESSREHDAFYSSQDSLALAVLELYFAELFVLVLNGSVSLPYNFRSLKEWFLRLNQCPGFCHLFWLFKTIHIKPW